jgi:hypothetical protein
MAIEQWSKKVMKEIVKHAERDDCYSCKQLLREIAAYYHTEYETFVKSNS